MTRTPRGVWVGLLAAVLLALGLPLLATAPPSAAASVTPVAHEGNPSCTDLGFDYGYRVDPPTGGTYVTPFGFVTVTTDGTSFDWTSTGPVDGVIAKGGPNANLYTYVPPSMGDTDLVSPTNSGTGNPYGLSHIDFCFYYRLTVSKTAVPTYTRTYHWTLDKVGSVSALTLKPGETYLVDYEVTADATYIDSAWKVTGDIVIANETPLPALVTGIADVVSPDIVPMEVYCPEPSPFQLAAGATVTCDYVAALPDATTRVNTATVSYQFAPDKPRTSTATADVVFGEPAKVVNQCLQVTDDKAGYLGQVCYDDALPYTFSYSLPVRYEVCLEEGQHYEFVNEVTGRTQPDKPGQWLTDSWTVTVEVPCETGCTLTPGYWKTHSEYGPAPYDETWALLGEDTTFFLSGQTYYEALWTAPSGGNAYYILARQYIAAELNVLGGASTPPTVVTALAQAHMFFDNSTPVVKLDKTTRARVLYLADLLDRYNNGYLGVPHCDF